MKLYFKTDCAAFHGRLKDVISTHQVEIIECEGDASCTIYWVRFGPARTGRVGISTHNVGSRYVEAFVDIYDVNNPDPGCEPVAGTEQKWEEGVDIDDVLAWVNDAVGRLRVS
jgi:hypothetical protein